MNRRQQRYFLLTIILLSFYLLSGLGCLNLPSSTDTTVIVHDDKNCGGNVNPSGEVSISTSTGTKKFTIEPGSCKSMSISFRGIRSSSGQFQVSGLTITVTGVYKPKILTVTFYGDCSGDRLLVPLEKCPDDHVLEVDRDNGGTPVITDGEPENPLPEDEVYPLEPEPELEPIGTACWASGTACSPIFSTDSRCCSGYCADGACN